MAEASVLKTVLTADVGNFTKNMQRASDTLDGFANVAKLAIGAFAFGKIAQGFETVVKAAEEQEIATRKLAMALASAGEMSDANMSAFEDMANQMQRTTTVADDAALKYAALAVNMGATAKQAIDLVPAAADMSAALGIEMDAAVRALSKSLSGNVTQLAKYMPELKGMTEEHLKAGGAIDVIADKFRGFAAGEMNTFTGQLTLVKHAWDEVLEAMGRLITEAPGAKMVIGKLGDALNLLAEWINANARDIRGFFVAIGQTVLATIKTILRALQPLSNLVSLLLKPIQLAMMVVVATVAQAIDGLLFATQGWLELLALIPGETGDTFKGIADGMRVVRDGLDVARDGVLGFLKDFDIGNASRTAVENIDNMIGALGEMGTTGEAATGAIVTGANGIATAIDNAKESWLTFDEIMIAALTDDEAFDLFQKKFAEATAPKVTGAAIGAAPSGDSSLAAEIIGATSSGMEPAVRLGITNGIQAAAPDIRSMGEFFGEDWLKSAGEGMMGLAPVIAAAAVAVFDFLASMTPDQFDKVIKNFMDSFVKALANIGPFIAVLIDNIDEIIMGLITGVVGGVVNIIMNIPNMIIAALNAVVDLFSVTFRKFAKGFIQDYARQTGELMIGLLRNLLPQLIEVFGAIASAVQWVTGAIISAVNGIAQGIGDAIEGLGDVLRAVFDFNWIGGKFNQLGGHFVDALGPIFESASKSINAIATTIGEVLSPILDGLMSGLGDVADALGKVAHSIVEQMIDISNAMGRFFANIGIGLVRGLIDFINHLIDIINSIPIFNDISRIDKPPLMHSGGIVPGPVGADVPIIAMAGERVLPVGESQGGGQPMNVTIMSAKLSPGEIADDVLLALRQLVRRGDIPSGAILAGQGV